MSDDLFFATTGPRDAKIALVGESWGSEEANLQLPFVGQSGKELDRMLHEVGLDRTQIFCTNVFNKQPAGNDAWRFFETNQTAKAQGLQKFRGLYPSQWATNEWRRLVQQLEAVRPELVIAAGNYALWALSSCPSFSSISLGEGVTVLVPGGILSWRGSMLNCEEPLAGSKLLPIIHPAGIMRAWYQRAVTLHDLKTRVPKALAGEWRPSTSPTIKHLPSYTDALDILSEWRRRLNTEQLRISHDIETGKRLITCMSLSTGHYDHTGLALVLPLVCPIKGGWDSFWTADQEFNLMHGVREVLTHPNVLVEGQNYLYDTQYIDHELGYIPRLDFDTMIAQHLLFPGTPKDLGYLSSLYCSYHWYWKEDLKEWDEHIDFEGNLIYNGEDTLRTGECATHLRQMIVDQGLSEQWEWEKRKIALALRMMRRGVAVDKSRKIETAFALAEAAKQHNDWLRSIVPQAWVAPYLKTSKSEWYDSPKQQQTLFYEILGLTPQTNRKTGRTTFNFEALENLKQKYPEFTKVFDTLLEKRSIDVFHDTFVMAGVDPDGRLRCSFNPGGTETFRWSSSKNAFGGGTNFQNIPKGEEE